MAESMTVVAADKVFEALDRVHAQSKELAVQLETAKQAEALAKKELANNTETLRYNYLDQESQQRTWRLLITLIGGLLVVAVVGDRFPGLLAPSPAAPDVAAHFMSLVDVRSDEKRVRNVDQIRKCIRAAQTLLPPETAASSPPAASAGDTRHRGDEIARLRRDCQPLLSPQF
jgi:hypothetical protein